MIAALIQLLVVLLVLLVLYWIVKLAATHFGAPPVLLQIVGVILLLIFVLAALSTFGFARQPMGAWRLCP